MKDFNDIFFFTVCLLNRFVSVYLVSLQFLSDLSVAFYRAFKFMTVPHYSHPDIQNAQLINIRSSGHSVTPQSAVGEPGEHLSLASLESLEAMSEGEAPSAFTRGSRSRASLPVVKSNNQAKDRSLGVLYLQYGEETKQIRMPNEVTGADTIKALFVSVFPQHLTMKTLESPSVAIYIKDDMRNMYYELTDVRCVSLVIVRLFLYPAQAFNHNARANNGEIRVSDKNVTAVPLNCPIIITLHVQLKNH
uniref:Actin interacting protein 3-like C-terminal domain-containing protein n=1 Tax=Sinocyclocheilus rhinocerous TaxID=307959 RepID=A0A673JR73_9TELE